MELLPLFCHKLQFFFTYMCKLQVVFLAICRLAYVPLVYILLQVPSTMEICLVKKTVYASQFPGLYMFTNPARMLRPVRNLALGMVEMIGTFEQVYLDICITQDEAYEGVCACFLSRKDLDTKGTGTRVFTV